MAERLQPRRNLLFVPGTRPDRFAKALAHRPRHGHRRPRGRGHPGAQGPRARPGDGAVRRRAARIGIERVVRINPLRTPFGLKDLLALILEHPSPPDGVMLPKVESADEVRIVDALLQRAARPIGLHVIIESNPGLDQALRDRRRLRLDALAAVRRRRHGGRARCRAGFHLACSMPARAWCTPPRALAWTRSTCPGSTSRTRTACARSAAGSRPWASPARRRSTPSSWRW